MTDEWIISLADLHWSNVRPLTTPGAPQRAGVYQLLGEVGELLYIGQSTNLARRMARHLDKLERDWYVWQARPETVWCRWAVVNTYGLLGDLERYLKQVLKPRYLHINSREKRTERAARVQALGQETPMP